MLDVVTLEKEELEVVRSHLMPLADIGAALVVASQQVLLTIRHPDLDDRITALLDKAEADPGSLPFVVQHEGTLAEILPLAQGLPPQRSLPAGWRLLSLVAREVILLVAIVPEQHAPEGIDAIGSAWRFLSEGEETAPSTEAFFTEAPKESAVDHHQRLVAPLTKTLPLEAKQGLLYTWLDRAVRDHLPSLIEQAGGTREAHQLRALHTIDSQEAQFEATDLVESFDGPALRTGQVTVGHLMCTGLLELLRHPEDRSLDAQLAATSVTAILLAQSIGREEAERVRQCGETAHVLALASSMGMCSFDP